MLRSQHVIAASGRALRQLLVALLVAVAILVTSYLLAMPLRGILGQAGLHLAMAALTLVVIATVGRARWTAYGFRFDVGAASVTRWRRRALAALGLGALASITLVPLSTGRMAPLEDLSLLQIIAFVWLLASTAEEILVRGWLQSHLSALRDVKLHLGPWQLDLPTVIGALFFSAMHLGLLMEEIGPLAAIIILVYAFVLGLLAGDSRAQSGSLVPAVIVHTLANVGGMVGGIIASAVTALLTGRPPVI